MAAPRIFIWGL